MFTATDREHELSHAIQRAAMTRLRYVIEHTNREKSDLYNQNVTVQEYMRALAENLKNEFN
jgi:hypothetical protein